MQNNNVQPTTATRTVNKVATMSISAEVKLFVAGLGNDLTWKKLPLDEEPNYNFINGLEEQIFDLARKVRSDKTGGTTGHIGLIMTATEFTLIPDTIPFHPSVYLGMVD